MNFVTVIIPTYNRSNLISRAVNSVLNQTFENWELIIVDDGSTDNTEQVLLSFTDQRIKYIKKENTGAAHSRNFGVDNANFDCITFLDSDDEAEPHWLEKMVLIMENEKASIVCCGITRYDENGEKIDVHLPSSMGKLFNKTVGRFTNGGSFMLKKSIFLSVGGYDPELQAGQHTELAFRLIPYAEEKKIKISNIYEPFIKVHIHRGPRIRYDYNAVFKGCILALKKHEQILKEDITVYSNHLSLAGVSGARTGRYEEAKKLFLKAAIIKRYSLKFWFRFILVYIPFLREKIWKIQSE